MTKKELYKRLSKWEEFKARMRGRYYMLSPGGRRKLFMAHLEGWEVDLFSTILSRRNSFHRQVGGIRLVRVRREGGR